MFLIEKLKKNKLLVPLFTCVIFFIAYSVLSIVRHDNYQSYGYDLGINDQVVWRYSNFQLPLTTIDPFPDKTKLSEHVELIYALISPSYWLWDSRKMLLLLEPAFLCISALAIFLLAKRKGLRDSISYVLLISYLGFYGIQNAIWFDVHSITFGASLVAWFLYFIDIKKYKISLIFLLLAITSKENIALITLLISFYYFLKNRNKWILSFILISIVYLLFIFKIYFPYIIQTDYLYQNKEGLLSNTNLLDLFNTKEKINTILYSFASFGFLPLFSPLALLPVLGHFTTYFVLGSDLTGAQGIFGHYRVMLAPLLSWATIISIKRFKKLNSIKIALLLLASTFFMQYYLHLPLSYLSKSWFWYRSPSVKNINYIKENILPKDASVVAQNNIIPHISHRDKIYSLYPEKKEFSENSPCLETKCDWFRWYDHPKYLFVDTSTDWDIRHLLANREDFIKGIENLKKMGVIKEYKKMGDTTLYLIVKDIKSI